MTTTLLLYIASPNICRNTGTAVECVVLSLIVRLRPVQRLSAAKSYCVVKWGGMELGRTRSCQRIPEPDWGEENFRLTLSDQSAAKKAPLVMEVWTEDSAGGALDFLGQVESQTVVTQDRVVVAEHEGGISLHFLLLSSKLSTRPG